MAVVTIADVIRRANGRAHAWRVERDRVTVVNSPVSADLATAIDGARTVERATLWHYGTAMLRWSVERPDDPDVLDWSTGWGSVSDQNGMNTAFRVLGLPYRFDRDARGGGPRVTELRKHACGHFTDSSVVALAGEERDA